jgi:hypothetical protein
MHGQCHACQGAAPLGPAAWARLCCATPAPPTAPHSIRTSKNQSAGVARTPQVSGKQAWQAPLGPSLHTADRVRVGSRAGSRLSSRLAHAAAARWPATAAMPLIPTQSGRCRHRHSSTAAAAQLTCTEAVLAQLALLAHPGCPCGRGAGGYTRVGWRQCRRLAAGVSGGGCSLASLSNRPALALRWPKAACVWLSLTIFAFVGGAGAVGAAVGAGEGSGAAGAALGALA